MRSPLALFLHDDESARERAREALHRAGLDAVAVATPREAVDLLRRHPSAVVAVLDGDPSPASLAQLQALCRLRSQDGSPVDDATIIGRSAAADALRRRVAELAATAGPVLFTGEPGSGRTHAARCLHATSKATAPLVVVAGDDPSAVDRARAATEGAVLLTAIERLPWSAQESLASAVASRTIRARFLASTALDPHAAADDGRLARPLIGVFGKSIVAVPSLRERRDDLALLARSFVEQLRRLNGLGPVVLAGDTLAALEAYAWPGNVRQLRGAIESAVTVAEQGSVRVGDLPAFVRGSAPPAASDGRADRRFRDAKRSIVESFERAYLEDLLRRRGGNVTEAAEHSGMLRSALQRLLRKHDLHSADFRGRAAPGRLET